MDFDRIRTELRGIVGEEGLLTEPEDLSAYEKGWRYGEGRAFAAVFPTSTDQVSALLAFCDEHAVRVQPQGANTGLVAASNPDATGEQVVLSLERLNRVIEVDTMDRVVEVEAGITLSRLNSALEEYGLFFPVDLGADPQIGGMIATNTGGTRLLRYGDVRRNLLGLEVVLADGSVVDRMRRLRKDNTGLDFRQLFVGTTGTWGVITRAVLDLAPLPRQRVSLLIAARGGEDVLALLHELERDLPEQLSAFEVISREALEITLRHGSRVRDPFGGQPPPYAVLVEFSTSADPSRLDLAALATSTLAEAMAKVDGVDPASAMLEQEDEFWHLRHQITESVRREGRTLAFDLSVPRSRLAEFSARIRRLVAEHAAFARVCDYGHWGDGGTHVNLVWDPGDAAARGMEPGSDRWRNLQDLVYALCLDEFSGSFSAEHGVGPHNQRIYDRSTPEIVRATCGILKNTFDPGRRLGTVRLGDGPSD